jgi:Protein of unknown function (DUF3102)
MPTSAPVTTFDYTALDIDTASFVRQQTGEIHSLVRRSAQDIFEIGQKLIQVKEKLGHGNFRNWLLAEFDWNERTAQNFMNVARQFKSETVADLPLAATALYILAAPSTPVEIREEAIARAQSGEPITKKKATAMTRSHSIGQKKTSQTKEENFKPSEGNTSPIADQNATFYREPEIIDAELESPPPQLPSPIPSSASVPDERVSEPDEVKALPPSPQATWWRLSGKEQTHLLFGGHPEDTEFLSQLPEQIGLWMGFPPTPDNWQSPPKGKKIKTALSYSTSYQGINLKAIRELMERLIPEISSEDDETAAIAYLPDAPLLFLFDDFGLDCYIAEPDVAQCQTIIKTWKDLDGQVEKLETLC